MPSGITLKKHYGDLVIRKAGTVIDKYDVHGNVTVLAKNVTIKRTKIRGNTKKVNRDLLRADGSISSGLRVYDVTIRPDTPTVYQRIGIRLAGTDQRVYRADISRTVDGIRIAGNHIRVEASWLHDFRHYSVDPEHRDGSHDDGIQIQKGKTLRIVNNSISGAKNAAIMAGQGLGPISDFRIVDNYIDGGVCAVNIAKKKYGYMTGIQAKYNRFGRGMVYKNCPMIYVPSHSDLKPYRNVWADTGKAIPLR